MSFEKPVFDQDNVANTDAARSNVEQHDSKSKQHQRKQLQERDSRVQAVNTDSEDDERKAGKILSEIQRGSDTAQDEGFSHDLREKINGVDGKKVLEEARKGLSPLYREVLDAGLEGPPPVDQKDLGTTLVIFSLAAVEVGDALKASKPPSMGFIISIAMKRVATPAFGVRALIEGCIEGAEGVQRIKKKKDPEFVAAIDNIANKFNSALTPAEKKSKQDFTDNMNRHLLEGKADGRHFLTEREREEAAEGGGYVLDWIMGKTLAEIGIYEDFEKMAKEKASPVSVLFEQPAPTSDALPNLVMKQKNSMDAKEFVELVREEIGYNRVKESDDMWEDNTWEVEGITAKELGKVGKILQTIIQYIDPKVEQKA